MIRVKGIYATALAKLFQEKGLKITGSKQLVQRLNLEPDQGKAEVNINTNKDMTGILIIGLQDKINEIVEILKKELKFVVVRYGKAQINALYKGLVQEVDAEKRMAKVKLDGIVGILPFKYALSRLNVGTEVLVQVKEALNQVIVSEKIEMIGKSMNLERNRINRFKVKAKVDEEEAKKEAEFLISSLKAIERTASQLKAPCLVKGGRSLAEVEFLPQAMELLDAYRAKVLPTIKHHHLYKSFGPEFCKLVDFCEKLNLSEAELKKGLEIQANLGCKVVWIHEKLDGTLMKNAGTLKEFKGGKLKVERIVEKPGKYDGLNIEKEIGDRILTEFEEGKEFVKHVYYNREGLEKGKYYSISSPLVFIQRDEINVRYLDLEVDVVELKGERKIVDKERLDQALKLGWITPEIHKHALELAESLKDGKIDP